MNETESTAVTPTAVEPYRPLPAPMPRELSVQEVAAQAEKIHAVMREGMTRDIHYGVIPGCKKPSLLQPGAEKLCLMFRLAPAYTIEATHDREASRDWTKTDRNGKVYKSGTCKGFARYTVACALTHGPTGIPVASGTGVCNNWEPKFISRDPYEVEETVLQFARKRALVNAARTATAASDIFTQDEDLIPHTNNRHDALADEVAEKFEADSAGDRPLGNGAGAAVCPQCGEVLRERTNKAKGTTFWGCTGYPKCRYTQNVAPVKLGLEPAERMAYELREELLARWKEAQASGNLAWQAHLTDLCAERGIKQAEATAEELAELIKLMDDWEKGR